MQEICLTDNLKLINIQFGNKKEQPSVNTSNFDDVICNPSLVIRTTQVDDDGTRLPLPNKLALRNKTKFGYRDVQFNRAHSRN